MEIDRDELVHALREHGQHEKAKQAEQQLPQKVDKDTHKGILDRLGIDDNLLGKLPGGIGQKLKGLL